MSDYHTDTLRMRILFLDKCKLKTVSRKLRFTFRTDFDVNRWRERGRANAGPDQDIFSMSPHSDFMKSLKLIGEDLVNQLKVSGT